MTRLMNPTRFPRRRPEGVRLSAGRPAGRRRGTVMFEILLVLPFILVIIAVLLHFGNATFRLHRAQVMDRYETWFRADQGHGPSIASAPGNEHINQLFQLGTARSINDLCCDFLPNEAAQWLEDRASWVSPSLQDMITQVHQDFPANVSVRFETRHQQSNEGVLSQFSGVVEHSHSRIGNDWKFVNGFRRQGGEWEHAGTGQWNLPIVRDVFYQPLDQGLSARAAQSPMAEEFRRWYLHRPSYAGPTLPWRP